MGWHDQEARHGERPRQSLGENASQVSRHRQHVLHLVAAVFIPQAPLAEVFAIVAEQPIPIFAEPGACPAHHLAAVKTRRHMASDPDCPVLREACERNLFHRASEELADHGPVVNDVTVSNVDTVVGVATTRCNEVRAQRRLLVRDQESVAAAKSAGSAISLIRSSSIARSSRLVRMGTSLCGCLHGQHGRCCVNDVFHTRVECARWINSRIARCCAAWLSADFGCGDVNRAFFGNQQARRSALLVRYACLRGSH